MQVYVNTFLIGVLGFFFSQLYVLFLTLPTFSPNVFHMPPILLFPLSHFLSFFLFKLFYVFSNDHHTINKYGSSRGGSYTRELGNRSSDTILGFYLFYFSLLFLLDFSSVNLSILFNLVNFYLSIFYLFVYLGLCKLLLSVTSILNFLIK